MCGRFALYTPQKIDEQFQLSTHLDFTPTYNAAPSQNLPVIVQQDGHNQAHLMHWGLVPAWAKDPAIGTRLINARADSVFVKPSFRHAFQSQRCLIPANGFYEWQKNGKISQPYYFKSMNNKLIAFAGLWEKWTKIKDKDLYTFTIITSDPNLLVQPIHDRMPVILPQESYTSWLSPDSDSETLLSLLIADPDTDLITYPVSPLINKSEVNSPKLIDPLPQLL